MSAARPPVDPAALDALAARFPSLRAEDRVAAALATLPGHWVMTSSFGAQAAVMIHLMTRQLPDIPVILLDTGYLFPETYRFVDELTQRFELNLRVFRAHASPAWQETRWGKLWEQGLAGIHRYNLFNKVEPMQRALAELAVGTWFSGLRRAQSTSRAAVAPVTFRDGHYRVHPIFDWTDRDVGRYMRAHQLPYHPLWQKGYVSIGDWHSTRSLAEAGSLDGTRFFGLVRECGLHGPSATDAI
jgi:phosphoadenosine phosphosulfate reductase